MNRILPIVLLSAAAIVVAVVVLSRRGEPLTVPGPRADDPRTVAPAEGAEVPPPGVDAPARAEVDQPAAETEAATEPGTLIVRVVWGDTGEPAAAIAVDVHLAGGDPTFDGRTVVTGPDGVARFDGLPPRRALATAVRGGLDAFVRARIPAGGEVEAELRLEGGIGVTGLVVDADGVPVAGADVLVAPWAGGEARALARTDPVGRFRLCALGSHCHVGARAAGYAPSVLQLVSGGDGAAIDVRIVLPARGGAVAGVVYGPDGRPVEGARVEVGGIDRGDVETFPDGTRGKAAMPAIARTDAEGRFAVDGVAAREISVVVRARGLAPWSGTTAVRVAERTDLEVRLEACVVLVGTVRDGFGVPVAGARIEVGRYGDLGHRSVRAGDDGHFRLEGLLAGTLELSALSEDHGPCFETITAVSGQTVEWDVVLDVGAVLRGRVVDDADQPVGGAMIEASQRAAGGGGSAWFRGATADDQGVFQLTGWSPGTGITLRIRRSGMFPELTMEDVMPGRAELVVRLPRADPIWIVGRVVGPGGSPAENVTVTPARRDYGSSPVLTTDAETGAFRLGPYSHGDYRVLIDCAGFPPVRTPWRTIRAGETADLGTIRLQEGGALGARLTAAGGGDLPELSVRVLDERGEFVSRAELRDGVRRSELLAPGAYLLQVTGATVASVERPFSIRPGVDSSLDVAIDTGVALKLALDAPDTTRRVHVEIFDVATGRTVLHTSAWRRDGEGIRAELGLRPGRYRFVATATDGLRGERTVDVAPGAAVEIVLPVR